MKRADSVSANTRPLSSAVFSGSRGLDEPWPLEPLTSRSHTYDRKVVSEESSPSTVVQGYEGNSIRRITTKR